MPARTRSTISERSNSAIAPMMTTMARPSGPGIDLLAERNELDLQVVQPVEDLEEMPCRSCDPITGPDQDDLEAAVTGVAHQLAEAGALGFHSADPVNIFLDDLEATLGRHLFEIEELGLEVVHTFSAAAFLPAMRPPMMQRAKPCSLNPPADSPAQ